MTEAESPFHLSCFDDDFESLENLKKINEYYEYLESHDYLELNWKCPGKKSLQKPEDAPKTPVANKESIQNAKQNQQQEFDFQEETEEVNNRFGSAPKRTIKKTPGQRTQNTFSDILNKVKKNQSGTPK